MHLAEQRIRRPSAGDARAFFRLPRRSNLRFVDLDQICCEKFYFNTTQAWIAHVDVKIDARPNGPYVITGSIELRDTNGNVLPTQERTVICRCGASTNKPFCDGTHSKIGFQAAAQAVPGSAEKS
jgi:CDGSH-type Zn-finger protein